jgi:hypothetical protein
MKQNYNYAPSLTISPVTTATSGPELAAYAPDPDLARQLAQTLIADQFDISERSFGFMSAGRSEVLGLVRR